MTFQNRINDSLQQVAGVLAYNELKQHVPGVFVPERDRKKGEGALLARSSTVEGGMAGTELVAHHKKGPEARAGGASDAKNKA